MPIYDTKVAVKCSEPVSRVYLAPQNVDVAYEVKDGYVTFTVDKLENHQMVVVE